MAEMKAPDNMTAVVLDSYSGANALRVEQRPLPQLGNNQVLVKMAAASINPSDLAFLDGNYGFKKPVPVVPGFEGSGTVIAARDGMMGRYLIGKRIACISQDRGDGVWADYTVTNINLALPLDESVSFEQGAMSVVNPLTAIALISLAKDGGHKTIINTAAAGALGQMVLRLGERQGIQVINIVRRADQVEHLVKVGAKFVLNSTELDYEGRLHDLCRQYKPHLAFDAIGGKMPQQLLDAMPPHSKVTVYGGLSEKPIQADLRALIFEDKAVDRFWLSRWLGSKNFAQKLIIWRRAQKLLATDLRSDIRLKYPLHEAVQAVKDYRNHMTGGKYLLKPET